MQVTSPDFPNFSSGHPYHTRKMKRMGSRRNIIFFFASTFNVSVLSFSFFAFAFKGFLFKCSIAAQFEFFGLHCSFFLMFTDYPH